MTLRFCLSLSALGRRSRLPGRGLIGTVLDRLILTEPVTFGCRSAVAKSIPRDGEPHLGPPRMKPDLSPNGLRDPGVIGPPQLVFD